MCKDCEIANLHIQTSMEWDDHLRFAGTVMASILNRIETEEEFASITLTFEKHKVIITRNDETHMPIVTVLPNNAYVAPIHIVKEDEEKN